MDTGINALKTASKKVISKADETTSEFLGNKINEKIVKPVKEITIPPTKMKRNI